MTTLTSLATSTDFGRAISLIEPPRGAKPPFNRAQQNLVHVVAPALVRVTANSTIQIVTSAAKMNSTAEGVRGLYSVVADLSSSLGVATRLGDDFQPGGGAASLASSIGLKLRSYGGSSKGHYLILPGGQGYRVLDTATLRQVGSIGLNPSSSFFPWIDEDSKLFVALSYGGSLTPVVYRVSTGGRVALGGLIARGNGGVAGPATSDTYGGFVWAEAASSSSGSVNIVHVTAGGRVTRGVFSAAGEGQTQGAHVFPQVAVLRTTGGNTLNVVVAYEKSYATSGSKWPYYFEGHFATLRLQGGKLPAVDITEYPTGPLTQGFYYGLDGHPFLISSFLASPNGNEVFRIDPDEVWGSVVSLRWRNHRANVARDV